MKRWLYLAPLAALVVIMGVALTRLTDRNPSTDHFAAPVRPAPAMELATLDGRAARLDQLGRPVLVNFWATWCGPCQAEHPMLLKLKEQGVEIVGVLFKDNAETARRALASAGDPFAQLALDPEGRAYLAFGVAGVPETLLIDAKGQILKTLRSPLDEAAVDEFRNAWLAEKAKSAGAAGPQKAPASPAAG